MNDSQNAVRNVGNVYFIELSKIHHNPLNDEIYGIKEDITQIKQNLLINGLQSPLEVLKEEKGENETSYRLLSGHGRYDSLLELYNENQSVVYQGKALGSKVPCLLHAPFEDSNAELEYLLGGNVRKFRDKESLKRAAIKAAEVYEAKKKAGKLEKGETKRKFICARTGLSDGSVDKYIKVDEEEKTTIEQINKIQSVSTVLNSIDKAKNTIGDIQMDEYGKTDKNTIKNKLDELIDRIKAKKKEK